MARRSVFISYAHADRPDVEESADLLRAGGVTVFIDVRDIDYGERWKDVLQKALDKCERVMVFWSLAAQASEWVEREWRYALALGKRIVPTLLDRTPLPAELAEFQAVRRFREAGAVEARSDWASERPRAPPPAPRRTRVAVAVTAALVGMGSIAVWTLRAPVPANHQSPVPTSPPQVPAADGFERARAALVHAGEVVSDTAVDERALTEARLALQRSVGENALRGFSAKELQALDLAAENARQRLQAHRQQVAAGRVGTATPSELQAVLALVEEVELTAMRLRSALSAAPPKVPARPPAPPAAKPAPAPELQRQGMLEPGPLALVGVAIAALVAGWRRRRAKAVPAEAAAFVREVFEA